MIRLAAFVPNDIIPQDTRTEQHFDGDTSFGAFLSFSDVHIVGNAIMQSYSGV